MVLVAAASAEPSDSYACLMGPAIIRVAIEKTSALVEAHATRGGRTLDYRTAEIVHIRDGKITERWAFSDDTQRITDFFA